MEHGPPDEQPRPKPIAALEPGERNLHRLAEPPRRLLRFKIDWRASFMRFCREHGEPIEHEGRLVFGDGWSHSATDHRGPCWPPPEDVEKLAAIRKAYWTKRLEIVTREHTVVLDGLEAVGRVAGSRGGAPLMVRGQGMPGARKAGQGEAREVDMEALRERLRWLAQAADECHRVLEELG